VVFGFSRHQVQIPGSRISSFNNFGKLTKNYKLKKQKIQNMKKQILSIFTASGLAITAFSQGSVNVDQPLANFGENAGGITTQGANATSTASATTFYNQAGTGGNNFTAAIWFSTTANAGEAAAINAFLNVTGGAASAEALFAADGFTEADAGATAGNVNFGSFNYSTGTILLPNVATSTSGYMALVGTAVGGAFNGWSGVIAFANGSGGNPNATPTPGTPTTFTGWNALNENLVLSPTAVPEPSTMALAGLGSLAALMFRRKK
jgi:hypothetical protein